MEEVLISIKTGNEEAIQTSLSEFNSKVLSVQVQL